MAGTQAHNCHYNLNIDTHIIHNLVHLLYYNVNQSCFGHPSCDLNQDKQLSDSHILGLSYNINYIFLKEHMYGLLTCEREKTVFSHLFLNRNILLNMSHKHLKFGGLVNKTSVWRELCLRFFI